MIKEKKFSLFSRLDESFSWNCLYKAFTGNVKKEIDIKKIKISSTGMIQSSS